jgi:hypothetical protein
MLNIRWDKCESEKETKIKISDRRSGVEVNEGAEHSKMRARTHFSSQNIMEKNYLLKNGEIYCSRKPHKIGKSALN